MHRRDAGHSATGSVHGPVLPPSFANLPIHPPTTDPSSLLVGAAADPVEVAADRLAARALGGSGPPAGASREARALPAPPVAAAPLRQSGRPLDPATRALFEPRLGFGLTGVRVHDGPEAASAARLLGAKAYTLGAHIVFGAGRYAPESSAGRGLIAHELAHVVRQGAGRDPAGIIRRQPDDASTAPGMLDIGPSDDLTGANRKLVDFVTAFRRELAASPQARVIATAFWNSKPAFDSGGGGKLESLRATAQTRADQVKAALVQLGLPAASVSDYVSDNNEAMASGPEGAVRLLVLRTPLMPPPVLLPRIDPASVTTAGPTPGTPLLDVTKDEATGAGNLRLGEVAKYQLVPQLKDPGGRVDVTAFVADDAAASPSGAAGVARKGGEDRANAVRQTLIDEGVNAAEIYAEARVVPAGDPRIGHVWVQFVPKAAKTDTSSGLDFDKFTTFQIQTPRLSFTIKVPKSIELKTRYVEGKISIPKGASLTFKPVPGVPGVEISLSGEITSLSHLVESDTPPATGGAAPPASTPPVKFSLSVAINGKGFKLEASAEVDLDNTDTASHRATITSGLYLTLIESGMKYQIPSSVLDDLNSNGAKLQKAINQLMGSTNPPAAMRAVGSAPPAPDKPQSALSNISDVADAIGGIADAMDKIDKAKTEKVSPKLKIGASVVDPIGPPGVGDTTRTPPTVTFGIKGYF